MNFNDLNIFISVVETHSFAKTGERLNISKSSISDCIDRLEKELNTTLLIRNRYGSYLTNEGEVFTATITRWIKEYYSLKSALSHNGLVQKFTLEGSELVLSYNCYQKILQYDKAAINIVTNSNKNYKYLLLTNKIDIALIYCDAKVKRTKNLKFKTIMSEPLSILVHRENILAKKEYVTINDFKNYRVLINSSLFSPEIDKIENIIKNDCEVIHNDHLYTFNISKNSDLIIAHYLNAKRLGGELVSVPIRDYFEDLCLVYRKNDEKILPVVNDIADILNSEVQ